MLQGQMSTLHRTIHPAFTAPAGPHHRQRFSRPDVQRRAAGPTPEQAAEMQKAMQAAMKDPQVS